MGVNNNNNKESKQNKIKNGHIQLKKTNRKKSGKIYTNKT